MADFQYYPTPAMIKSFFAKIQSVGKPDKVTIKYLESTGFKSKNDRYIIQILKSLGLLDPSGTPTESWQRYRNKTEAPAILAQAIRTAYAGLFSVYPDANRKDDEALRNFFTSKTSVGDKTVAYMVRTFKALCELVGFESMAAASVSTTIQTTQPVPSTVVSSPAGRTSSSGMTINVNIQLTLPETKEAAVYDTIFTSLKKHLLS
jgi:hypothetical protein